MKAVKMWAVFTPKGKMLADTVSPIREGSMSLFQNLHTNSFFDDHVTIWWSHGRDKGYAIRRVTVTPDAGGE